MLFAFHRLRTTGLKASVFHLIKLKPNLSTTKKPLTPQAKEFHNSPDSRSRQESMARLGIDCVTGNRKTDMSGPGSKIYAKQHIFTKQIHPLPTLYHQGSNAIDIHFFHPGISVCRNKIHT